MTPSDNLIIRGHLRDIEKQHRVRILYACELGSRAWGFDNADSDFDIKFIFVRSPRGYLSLFPESDSITVKISEHYEAAGWDIRKALNLLYTGNCQILEWFKAERYTDDNDIINRLKAIRYDFFNIEKSLFNYCNLATSSLSTAMSLDSSCLKYYLHTFRSLAYFDYIRLTRSFPFMLKALPIARHNKWDASILKVMEDFTTIRCNDGEINKAQREMVNGILNIQVHEASKHCVKPSTGNGQNYHNLDDLVCESIMSGFLKGY